MNTSTTHQRNAHRIAVASIATLTGAAIASAAGPATPQHPQFDRQHQQLAWMQPDTRDRRDHNTGRYDAQDKSKEKDKDKADAHRVEPKTIDMNRVTTARELLGAEVFSTTLNESIGTASDLIIATDSGDIEWLILDKGALLQDLVAISMDEVTWHRAQNRFTTSIAEARLAFMPTFEADSWPGLRHESWYGAIQDFLIGDERRPLGTIRHVRANDILGQTLLANMRHPEDPNVDATLDDDDTDIERTDVAEVHDIVLAMDIERAPVVIARTDGLMRDAADRAVPINAVRWDRRDPILMNVTDDLYEAITRLPENYPAGARQPTAIVHAFRSFKVPALIKQRDDMPRDRGTPQR